MIVAASLRPSARLTTHHRGEHQIRLYQSATIGWSQPLVDRSNEDGSLETDRKFVEARSSEYDRPVSQGFVDDLLSRGILEAFRGIKDEATDPRMQHIRFEKQQVVVALWRGGEDSADDLDELVPRDVRNPGASRPGRLPGKVLHASTSAVMGEIVSYVIMTGHVIEGPDRFACVLGPTGHQVTNPIDLAAQLIQPLPADLRGQQLRSQVHRPNYVHRRRHAGAKPPVCCQFSSERTSCG